MDKEREEIMEMLSKNNMNISSQSCLCDKETDVPVWEFSTILYKETYDERVSDEIEAKEVSEIGGWCVPTTKNYTVENLLTTCINNAAGIICFHNHPSGDTTPSSQDRAATNRLKQAGELLGIPVIDHIIVGDDFLSFKAEGLL